MWIYLLKKIEKMLISTNLLDNEELSFGILVHRVKNDHIVCMPKCIELF